MLILLILFGRSVIATWLRLLVEHQCLCCVKGNILSKSTALASTGQTEGEIFRVSKYGECGLKSKSRSEKETEGIFFTGFLSLLLLKISLFAHDTHTHTQTCVCVKQRWESKCLFVCNRSLITVWLLWQKHTRGDRESETHLLFNF